MRRSLHTLVEQSIRDLIQRYFYPVSRTQVIDAINHPKNYTELMVQYKGDVVDFMKLSREKQIEIIKSMPK